MQVDTRSLLRYWRNSLADVELSRPSMSGAKPLVTDAVTDGDTNGDDVLSHGELGAALTRELFARVEEERKKRKRRQKTGPNHEEDELRTIRVLIAPLRLRRKMEHGQPGQGDREEHAPLWLGASLTRDGKLYGDPDLIPWVVRDYLEPTGGWGRPVLGLLEDADRFLTREPPPENDDWQRYFDFATGLFQRVTGSDFTRFSAFELPDYETIGPIVVLAKVVKGPGRQLIETYDQLLAAETTNPMLRSLTTPGTPRETGRPDDLAHPGHRAHLGQMTDAFALAPSQRQSLHAVLALGEHEIAAIEGPPGTGKTTLLRSLVASLWVESALQGGEPPIIHACSNNNQAVTNILDSFDAAASVAEDPLARRWLPEVASYGLYLPSRFQLQRQPDKIERYQCAEPGNPWHGFPAQMESWAYFARAEPHYLDAARVCLPADTTTDVERVVAHLHGEMERLAGELRDRLEAAKLAAGAPIFSAEESAGCSGPEIYRRAEQQAADLHALRREALDRAEGLPFWEELLAFLAPVKERRDRRLARPFLDRGITPPAFPRRGLHTFIDAHLRSQLLVWDAYVALGKEALAVAAARPELEATVQRLLADPARIVELLDRTQRYRLFLLAGRYWEGRWLLEMRQLQDERTPFKGQSRKRCLRRLRRLAKITPIMVSTFYRAPKIFDFYDGQGRPLEQGIDLLIVDEAGQVTPEVAAPVFALARRAVVVGDIHQIEPIWGVTPPIDNANLAQAGLDPADFTDTPVEVLRADRGSLMEVAQLATCWRAGKGGLFLSEHRRSVPTIISYCNELVYGGRLQPKRQAADGLPLPALGWAHVDHPSASRGQSRANPGQARAIADWLAERREELEAHYGGPLGEIVGIVTPFAAQRKELRDALWRADLHGREIEVGTVHTFQGAERPVMLFSAVYSRHDPGRYFFDRGPNMLNVAVSRARDSFIVFGDMVTFDPGLPYLPSGLLAKHLFASQANEITDVVSAQKLLSDADTETNEVRRLATLEEHRQTLDEALTASRERVLIVSPYLSPRALEADGIEERVEAARGRGVEVVVAYCRDFGSSARRTRNAVTRLQAAGADVIALERIHNKTLAVDDRWLAEGSFNWLSSVREAGHPFQRREASLRCGRPTASKFIDDAWKAVQECSGS